MPRLPLVALALASCLSLLAGCAQGPSHTRAAGAITGTVLGAALGSAASAPGHKGEGAALGAAVGFLFGAAVGDDVAREQELARAAQQPPPLVYVPLGMPPPAWAVYAPAAPGSVPPPPPGYVAYVLVR